MMGRFALAAFLAALSLYGLGAMFLAPDNVPRKIPTRPATGTTWVLVYADYPGKDKILSTYGLMDECLEAARLSQPAQVLCLSPTSRIWLEPDHSLPQTKSQS